MTSGPKCNGKLVFHVSLNKDEMPLVVSLLYRSCGGTCIGKKNQYPVEVRSLTVHNFCRVLSAADGHSTCKIIEQFLFCNPRLKSSVRLTSHGYRTRKCQHYPAKFKARTFK